MCNRVGKIARLCANLIGVPGNFAHPTLAAGEFAPSHPHFANFNFTNPLILRDRVKRVNSRLYLLVRRYARDIVSSRSGVTLSGSMRTMR